MRSVAFVPRPNLARQLVSAAMDRPARLRNLDRIAGALLALPTLVSLWFGVQGAVLGLAFFRPSASSLCEGFCALFLLLELAALLVTLVNLGVAVSVWTGTRLGRPVGLAFALAGSWWSMTNVAERVANGFGLATDEVRWMLLLAVVCVAAAIVLLLALRDWVALVLAERR